MTAESDDVSGIQVVDVGQQKGIDEGHALRLARDEQVSFMVVLKGFQIGV